MAGVRALLTRVAKLEAARATPKSPFEVWYGSLEAFGETSAAGGLDKTDWPLVMACLRRWERDGTWGMWRRMSNAAWEHGPT
jgi:hypothetical protein